MVHSSSERSDGYDRRYLYMEELKERRSEEREAEGVALMQR